MNNWSKSRMTFDRFIEVIVVGFIGYIGTQAKAISDSVASLNVKMASIVEHISNQDKTLEIHEQRIEKLEIKRRLK